MYRFAALIFTLLGFLIPASVTAIDTKSLEKHGLIPKSLETLGINQMWTIEETRQRFAEAGIGMADPQDLPLFIEGRLSSLEDAIAEDAFVFRQYFTVVGLAEFPRECLYYANGIEKRADIQAVAVCFASKGEKNQFLVVAVFRGDRITVPTLKSYLQDIYGEPYYSHRNKTFWRYRPWFYAGLLTKNYIYLEDDEVGREDSRQMVAGTSFQPVHMEGSSGVLFYADASGMITAYESMFDILKEAQESDEQAEEQAKKDARKGL